MKKIFKPILISNGKKTHFEFFFNSFYNGIFHYIYLSPTGQIQNNYPVYRYEQQNAKIYGLETGFHFHPHPWDFVHLKIQYETLTGQTFSGDYLPLKPPDRIKTSLECFNPFKRKNPVWNTGINWTYTFPAKRIAPQETERPGYHLLDFYTNLNFNNSPGKWNFFLRINNLLNIKYVPHLSAYRDQNVPEAGRSILIGMKVNF